MQFAFEQEGTVGTRGYFSLDKAEMLLEITMSKFGKTVLEIVERMISSVFHREVIQQYHLERGGLLDSILTMMAEHRSQSLRHAVRYQREQQRH